MKRNKDVSAQFTNLPALIQHANRDIVLNHNDKLYGYILKSKNPAETKELSHIFVPSSLYRLYQHFFYAVERCKDDDISHNNRYIYKTIDTELIPFTPKYQYKCYEIKIFIPLTTNEIFITSTFTGFFILIIISALSNMDEDGRDFMIGYMAARSMRKKRKW